MRSEAAWTLVRHLEWAWPLAKLSLRRHWIETGLSVLGVVVSVLCVVEAGAISYGLTFPSFPGVADPGSLVEIHVTTQAAQNPSVFLSLVSEPVFRDVKNALKESSIEASYETDLPVLLGGEPRQLRVAFVSHSYFQMLRVAVPTTFGNTRNAGRASPVALLSATAHGLRAETVGRVLTIAGQPVIQGGVVPDGFRGTSFLPVDLWLPLESVTLFGFDAGVHYDRNTRWLRLFARLAPRSEPRRIQQQVIDLLRRTGEAPVGLSTSVEVARLSWTNDLQTPVLAKISNSVFSVAILVLLSSVFVVLGLGIIRALRRRACVTMLMALGAPRRVLAFASLCELVLINLVAGGLVALVYAARDFRLIIGSQLFADARLGVVNPLIPAVLLIATTLLAALPVLLIDIRNVAGGSLRIPLRGSRQVRLFELTGASLAAFLGCVLGTTTALLTSRTIAMAHQSPGFRPGQLYEINLPVNGSTLTQHTQALELAQRRFVDREGIVGASLSSTGVHTTRQLVLLGVEADRNVIPGEVFVVDSGFFRIVGARLLAGRALDARDDRSTSPVAVVDSLFAGQLAKGATLLGECVHIVGSRAPCWQVVGIAAPVLFGGPLQRSPPQLFLARAQSGLKPTEALFVRAQNARVLKAAISHVRDSDTSLRYMTSTGTQATWDATVTPLRNASSVGLALAAIMTAVVGLGTFAIIALSLEMRRQEFAIRAALGSPRLRLLRDLTNRLAAGTLAGTLLGTVVGMSLARATFAQLGLRAEFAIAPIICGAAPALIAICIGVAPVTVRMFALLSRSNCDFDEGRTLVW